jgi:hypothetical protein
MTRIYLSRYFSLLLVGLVMISLSANAALAGVKRSGSKKADLKDMALVQKTIKTVTYKVSGGAYKMAARGQVLGSGDMVKTGDQSSAILRFIEGSVVRISESSEVVVKGEKQGDKLTDKNVNVNFGKLGFDVKSRPGEQFRFSSPTAVASIKGTAGLFGYSKDGGTTLTISEGSAELETKDGKKYNVGPNQTAFMNSDGTSGTRPASASEIQNSGVITKASEIRIEFKDKDGNPKSMTIMPK